MEIIVSLKLIDYNNDSSLQNIILNVNPLLGHHGYRKYSRLVS